MRWESGNGRHAKHWSGRYQCASCETIIELDYNDQAKYVHDPIKDSHKEPGIIMRIRTYPVVICPECGREVEVKESQGDA